MSGSALDRINHIVVLMLENRSFDHMLGYLPDGDPDYPPNGQSFEGLTGKESNPDSKGKPVPVSKITSADLQGNPYFMPGADPGEGYDATNWQLWGQQAQSNPPPYGTAPTMEGFVTNWENTLVWENKEGWTIYPGTTTSDIMGIFTPQLLPVLSTLAKEYAVFDHWYCSAPTETLPNRAFMHFGTSEGLVKDKTAMSHIFRSESAFKRLSNHDRSWLVYGYDNYSDGHYGPAILTRLMVHDVSSREYNDNFRSYVEFEKDAAAGKLADYTFLTPGWGASGNSQHPPYDVAAGEILLAEVYKALRGSPSWSKTLLILTYDEHGGCYDHVPPPWGAVPPDAPSAPPGTLHYSGQEGFGFDRFGVRVPTVMISPWIKAGTVVSAPASDAGGNQGTPFDHTSILATVEEKWGLGPLTARDQAAPHVGQVLNGDRERTDDALAEVTVPELGDSPMPTAEAGYLEKIMVERLSLLPGTEKIEKRDKRGLPEFNSAEDCLNYIHRNYASHFYG